MENLIKKANTQHTTLFANFSKFRLETKQMKNIKGGNGDGEGEGNTSIVTEDVVGG